MSSSFSNFYQHYEVCHDFGLCHSHGPEIFKINIDTRGIQTNSKIQYKCAK